MAAAAAVEDLLPATAKTNLVFAALRRSEFPVN